MIDTLDKALAEINRLHKVLDNMQKTPHAEKVHGEFVSWGKTPRLFRDVVISEKIDGTNSCVVIFDVEPEAKIGNYLPWIVDETQYWVGAQSRNRLITPENDNAGFARWVWDNAEKLIRTLGVGRHFGEWFGSKVQRKYGYKNGEMFFALFNVKRHAETDFGDLKIILVPVLYEGVFSEAAILNCIEYLKKNGSCINGFPNAEGVIVFHTANNSVWKVLCENDNLPKSLVEVSNTFTDAKELFMDNVWDFRNFRNLT